MSYKINVYATHIKDKVRTEAYINALKQVIIPNETIVLDLGAGTGFFTLMACHLGAKHVYAIELNPAIKLLHKQAEENGWSDRITVFEKKSTEVDLPEKVDVIISDLRGGMTPLFRQHIPTLHDAKQRFLKEDGILIPQNDTIYISVITDKNKYNKRILSPWDDYPFDMSTVSQKNVNNVFRNLPTPDMIALSPQVWTSIDYGIQKSPTVRNNHKWTVDKEVEIHFISTWFESKLLDNIRYTTNPFIELNNRPTSYSGMYMPLQNPIVLYPNETLEVEAIATFISNSNKYIFSWNTRVQDINQSTRLHYQQSTFFIQDFAF